MAGLKFAAIVLVPVIALQAVMLPFWLDTNRDSTAVASAQLFFTAVAIPSWLAVQGCRLVLRRMPPIGPIGPSVLVVAFVMNIISCYSLWGIGTGMFWHPDRATLMIIQIAFIVGVVVAASPPLLLFIFSGRIIRPEKTPRRDKDDEGQFDQEKQRGKY
jgi:hypothetical protein